MEPNIFRMLFLSKIKNLWCCKTPVPWVGPKHPFPTWDIDPVGYLLKRSFHPLKMGTIKSSFWVRMVLSYFWVQNKWGCPQRHEKNSFGDISRRDFYLDANATLCSFWPLYLWLHEIIFPKFNFWTFWTGSTGGALFPAATGSSQWPRKWLRQGIFFFLIFFCEKHIGAWKMCTLM